MNFNLIRQKKNLFCIYFSFENRIFFIFSYDFSEPFIRLQHTYQEGEHIVDYTKGYEYRKVVLVDKIAWKTRKYRSNYHVIN